MEPQGSNDTASPMARSFSKSYTTPPLSPSLRSRDPSACVIDVQDDVRVAGSDGIGSSPRTMQTASPLLLSRSMRENYPHLSDSRTTSFYTDLQQTSSLLYGSHFEEEEERRGTLSRVSERRRTITAASPVEGPPETTPEPREAEERQASSFMRRQSSSPPSPLHVSLDWQKPLLSPQEGGPAGLSRGARASPMHLPMAPPAAASTFEQLWESIDRHLFLVYTSLQQCEEEAFRDLHTPQHRMRWYTIIYNACSGDPAKSRELYARLALLLVKILESHVLFPILQSMNKRRVRFVTDRDHVLQGGDDSISSMSGSRLVGEGSVTRSLASLLWGGGSEGPPRGWQVGPSTPPVRRPTLATTGPSAKDERNGAPATEKKSTSRNTSFSLLRFFAPRTSGKNGDSARSSNGAPARLSSFVSEPITPLGGEGASSGLRSPLGDLRTAFVGFDSAVLHNNSTSNEMESPTMLTQKETTMAFVRTPPSPGVHARVASTTGRVLVNEEEEILCQENAMPSPSGSLRTMPSSAESTHTDTPRTSRGPAQLEETKSAPGEEDSDRMESWDEHDEDEELGDDDDDCIAGASDGLTSGPPTLPTTATPRFRTAVSKVKRGRAGLAPQERSSPESAARVPRSPGAAPLDLKGDVGDSLRSTIPAEPESTMPPREPTEEEIHERRGKTSSPPLNEEGAPQFSLCYTFVQEWETFTAFRRVVLSCFRYLDQYYTRRFGMDTIGLMCYKVFYVVVYEPLLRLLREELRYIVDYIRTHYSQAQSVAQKQLELVQSTYHAMMEVLVIVHSTSSHMMAGGSRGAGIVTAYPGGGATLRPPPPVTVPVDGASSRASSRGRSVGRGAGSNPSSVASTPRSLPMDAMRPPSLRVPPPTGAPGGSQSARSGSATRLSKRKRLILFFSGGRIRDNAHEVGSPKTPMGESSPLSLSGTPRADALDAREGSVSAPTTPMLRSGAPRPVLGGANFSSARSEGGAAEEGGDENRFPKQQTYTSPFEAAAARQASVEAEGEDDHTPVVNLNSVIQLRERLEGNSVAMQAMKQWERMPEGHRHQLGTLIYGVAEPLSVLVMEVLVNAYIAEMRFFYARERRTRLRSDEGRAGYLAWATGVRQLEKSVWSRVSMPLLTDAVEQALVEELAVQEHRVILRDEVHGFKGLVAAWSDATVRELKRAHDDRQHPPVSHTRAPSLMDTHPAPYHATRTPSMSLGDGPLFLEETATALQSFFQLFSGAAEDGCFVLMASLLVSRFIAAAAEYYKEYLSVATAKEDDLEGGGPGHLPPTTAHPSRARPGAAPVPAPHKDLLLIDNLLSLYQRYMLLIVQHFNAHPILIGAMKEGMQECLCPSHWTARGALEAQRLRARKTEGDGGGARGLPSILLNRDASRAVAPLIALAEGIDSVGRIERLLPMPALLAVYCDRLFRWEKSTAHIFSEIPTKRALLIARVVALVEGKEEFLEHHRLLLARRLLGSAGGITASCVGFLGGVNIEAEKELVTQLQNHIGASSTQAFDVMLRDYDGARRTAADLAKESTFAEMKVHFSVMLVSSSAYWPSYRALPLLPHRSLSTAIDSFRMYYRKVQSSRALVWVHSLGSATLLVHLPGGNKEVVAHTVPATILLLVGEAGKKASLAAASVKSGESTEGNECEAALPDQTANSITGRQLANLMHTPFDLLRPHVQLLVKHKPFALLRRVGVDLETIADTTESPTVGEKDRYTLNEHYTHRLHKVLVPMPRPSDPSGVNKDRAEGGSSVPATAAQRMERPGGGEMSRFTAVAQRQRLTAAIVSIMKSRRTISMEDLQRLVVSHVSRSFTPKVKEIKAQLQDLIEKEYVKRSSTNAESFEYIA